MQLLRYIRRKILGSTQSCLVSFIISVLSENMFKKLFQFIVQHVNNSNLGLKRRVENRIKFNYT